MHYTDQGFEEFGKRWVLFGQDRPLSWRLRDAIYATLTAAESDIQRQRRHRAGVAGWLAWVIKETLRAALRGSSRISSGLTANWGFMVQSTPAHFNTLFPVIKEVAQKENVIVWMAAATPDEEKRLGSIANVKCVKAEWHNSWGNAAAIIADARQAWCEFKDFENETALSRQERLALKARRIDVLEIFYRYLNWKRIWTSVGLGRVNKGVFVSFELAPSTKALVDVYRDRGLRCIQFCHGFRNALYAVSRCTDYCALSEADQKWFVTRMDSGCRVHAIGNPRLEAFIKDVGPTRRRNAKEPLRLLFLSQYPGWDFLEEMRNQVLALLKLDERTRRNCILRMRHHPNETIASLGAACEAQGLRVDEWSTGSLEDDIRWCDAAATCFSTALLEAAVCGRLCYWINPVPLISEAVAEWQKAGVGMVIPNSEVWTRAMEQAISGTVRQPASTGCEHFQKMRVLADNNESWLARLALS